MGLTLISFSLRSINLFALKDSVVVDSDILQLNDRAVIIFAKCECSEHWRRL